MVVQGLTHDLRAAKEALEHRRTVVAAAHKAGGGQVAEFLGTVDMPVIAQADPLGDALAIFQQRPVERCAHAGEVGPVAGKAPALDEAEHLGGNPPAAVELLVGGQSLAADKQKGEPLGAMSFSSVGIAFKHYPVCKMLRAVGAAEEGIPVAMAGTSVGRGIGRNHFQLPVGGDVLFARQMSVGQHVIAKHAAGVAQEVALRHGKVAVNKAVDAQMPPLRIAEADGTAVGGAGRIVEGVFQDVVQRDGTELDPVGSIVV